LDTNANILYNYLVANISIDASASGDYKIEGRLYDSTHTVFITTTENTTYLSVGLNVVPLWLNGREIYNSSEHGPYNLTLYSYNMDDDLLEKSYYDTDVYTYDQFEHEAPDSEPPTISSVQAQPDPQEVYGSVNVSAVVTDNDEVWQVHIELTDPDGLDVGNFSMSYHGGTGRYYHARTYSKIGTYSFVISAKDPSNNWNSAMGFVRHKGQPGLGLRLTGLFQRRRGLEWVRCGCLAQR